MQYVYRLQSQSWPDQHHVGSTSDLQRRFADRNAGRPAHTSKPGPWKLVTHVACSDSKQAASLERYLKSGSDHAFAGKRLW
jgi:predicted GIY-YIG superfamily endonuclease